MANGPERPRERGSPFAIDHSPFTYSPEMQKAPPDGPDEASLFLAGHCFLITAHLSPDRSGAGFSTYHRTSAFVSFAADFGATMVAKASQGQSLCLSG
jgi:hypothetical protein